MNLPESRQLNGIAYSVRRSRRARRIIISVRHPDQVTVTIPWRANSALADQAVIRRMDWIVNRVEAAKTRVVPQGTRDEYIECKARAKKFVLGRLEYFNASCRFKYSGVSIRNPRTRWGSCSRNSRLNFSYKIIFLPPEVADYLIVHELCHLGEFNHSRRFWNLVSVLVPEYQVLRKKLRSGIF